MSNAGAWGMQLVHNTLLSLSPHAFPLLQHGIPLMGYNPSLIAPAWVFSKGYSPSGVDCSSTCLLQTSVSAGSLLQHELSMVYNFLRDTSACWGIGPSMGHRLDVFSGGDTDTAIWHWLCLTWGSSWCLLPETTPAHPCYQTIAS